MKKLKYYSVVSMLFIWFAPASCCGPTSVGPNSCGEQIPVDEVAYKAII